MDFFNGYTTEEVKNAMDILGVILVGLLLAAKRIHDGWKGGAQVLSEYPAWIKRYTITRTGIDNTPPQTLMANFQILDNRVHDLEIILQALGRATPINITSAYRNEKVEKAVGGVKGNRDHSLASAIDFYDADPVTLVKLLKPYIDSRKLGPVYQLIAEQYQHVVHLSWYAPGIEDRGPKLMVQYAKDGPYKGIT